MLISCSYFLTFCSEWLYWTRTNSRRCVSNLEQCFTWGRDIIRIWEGIKINNSIINNNDSLILAPFNTEMIKSTKLKCNVCILQKSECDLPPEIYTSLEFFRLFQENLKISWNLAHEKRHYLLLYSIYKHDAINIAIILAVWGMRIIWAS